MVKRIACALLAAPCVAPAWADSLSVGAVADDQQGRSISLSGNYSPVETLTLGASIGHSRARLEEDGEVLSGTSYGLSADLSLGGFFAYASGDRWTDTDTLRSVVLRGELGWMSSSGLAIAALVTDREMRVTYTATVLGEPRERHIEFEGLGFGGDVAWYAEEWTVGARYLAYEYGNSVTRVRAIIDAANTERFPRLGELIGSVVTRAAAAPDRELSLQVGRLFANSSLNGMLHWQRDALTGEKSTGVSLTLGLRPARHLGVDVSAGATEGEAGTAWWAGLTLSLRRAEP